MEKLSPDNHFLTELELSRRKAAEKFSRLYAGTIDIPRPVAENVPAAKDILANKMAAMLSDRHSEQAKLNFKDYFLSVRGH